MFRNTIYRKKYISSSSLEMYSLCRCLLYYKCIFCSFCIFAKRNNMHRKTFTLQKCERDMHTCKRLRKSIITVFLRNLSHQVPKKTPNCIYFHSIPKTRSIMSIQFLKNMDEKLFIILNMFSLFF